MIKPNETREVNPDETREVNPDEVVAMGAANDANDNYWNNKKHAEIELKQIYGTRGCDAILSQSTRTIYFKKILGGIQSNLEKEWWKGRPIRLY